MEYDIMWLNQLHSTEELTITIDKNNKLIQRFSDL